MPINYSKTFQIRDSRNGSWFWVHTHVWRDSRLGKSDKLVYGTLASYANAEQEMFPSISRISKDSGCSERQVYQSIKILELRNYLSISRKTGQHNVYTLLKTLPDDTPEEIAPLQSFHPTPAKNDTTTPAKKYILTRSNITRTT